MAKHGKYGTVNRNNPEPVGYCDRGNEPHKLSDLKKEMIWVGDRLEWNGKLVCEHHLDPPHPQLRLYIPKPDPVPVENPRFYRKMVPMDGYLDDGTPTSMTTASYVTETPTSPPIRVKFPDE